MSNHLVKFEEELLDAREQWAPVLPGTISEERFKSVVISAINKNPALLNVDRRSLLIACTQAAQDGLVPDGREGAITIFRDLKSKTQMAQWMPMVAGILKRCREKGELTSISAYCVYKDDEFDVVLGTEPKVVHKPNFLAKRTDKDIVLAYAIFRNGDQVVHQEFMTRDEIEHTRSVSRARDGGAWRDWYSEMCRKTVIRRGSKSIPLSSDIAQIIERNDQWVDFGLRDIAREDSNPLNDGMVIDAQPIIVSTNGDRANGGHVEVTNGAADSEYQELLEKLESCQSLDELNQFTAENKQRLQALSAPLLGRIRARYRERQHDLRKLN